MPNRLLPQFFFPALALLPALTGCAVPQAPGGGVARHEVEPITGSSYWLYLPEDYVKNDGQRADGRRWPLVVTFHGMKPWDGASPQCREWQEEADRYGFIILAPSLRTCAALKQFPLRDRTLSYVIHDERAVLAMMDEVFRRTNADPTRVLSTSWSSGGYIAHFMVNQYPERFTVLAVRQSNFSEDLLDAATTPAYRHMHIGIFFGENDLPICRTESLRAVEWYRQHHFRVDAKLVSGLGHERTPQTAAAYFALAIGAEPKTPPKLNLVMEDIPVEELEKMRRKQSRRGSQSPESVSAVPAGAPSRSLSAQTALQRIEPQRGTVGRAAYPGRSGPPANLAVTPKGMRQPPSMQPYSILRHPMVRTPWRPGDHRHASGRGLPVAPGQDMARIP